MARAKQVRTYKNTATEGAAATTLGGGPAFVAKPGQVASESLPVVLFCGGTGTRLREETEHKPKPLVPVGNQPVLWHVMKIYHAQGFHDFVLCLGYKGQMIKEYFLNYELYARDVTVSPHLHEHKIHDHETVENWTVTLADTGQKSQTGRRLKLVEKYLGDAERFMVSYGDGVADVNLEHLLAFHKSHGKLATITGAHPTSKYGLVQADRSGRIEAFQQKPRFTDYTNIGYMVFERSIFDYLKNADTKNPMIEDVFLKLVDDGELMLYRHPGFFYAMDTYKDYETLNELWTSGQRPWQVWEE